ncbi:glycosyltransferase family protein [Desulfovibrio litoralis]|uniref:Glycosyl transferases group 1 n=1 Tax=Desulfovibrio litoralis DSM 11393 TaxID=1121455 RepID=A0A1M7SQ54_9BACT|nr:DUF3880 domain-containing protein [Desulfovibrio litoralis]SHN60615.1 Glycosyl transferases group 1 [Desulfovibrio litoralis DSM 11393]
MPNNQRKIRLQVYSEIGLKQSLSSGEEAFILRSVSNNNTATKNINIPKAILILGLGDDPKYLETLLNKYHKQNIPIYYIENDDFLKQMSAEYLANIPSYLKRINKEDLEEILQHKTLIIQYQQADTLFPSFWWSIINKIEIYQDNASSFQKTTEKTLFLVSSEKNLLHFELTNAFQNAGFKIIHIEKDCTHLNLKTLIYQHKPSLYFSLNCEGFGTFGEKFFLLRELGVECASWFVDNPWNIITLLKSKFWQELYLFCTDNSLIPDLKKLGTKNITHLPLACDSDIFKAKSENQDSLFKFDKNKDSLKNSFKNHESRLIFVGNSAFPNKVGFFSGLKIPIEIEREAEQFYTNSQGERPDFFWWLKKLNIQLSLNNKNFRLAAFGADNSSALWRMNCINALSLYNPLVYGDSAWKNLLPPSVKVNPPVDYYSQLPTLYKKSMFTLNATSFLLPQGLNQRCFDVWSSGGFLITDYHKGMDIFPSDMVKRISFHKKNEILPLLDSFLENSKLYFELKDEWNALILKEHSYKQRIDCILKQIFD